MQVKQQKLKKQLHKNINMQVQGQRFPNLLEVNNNVLLKPILYLIVSEGNTLKKFDLLLMWK